MYGIHCLSGKKDEPELMKHILVNIRKSVTVPEIFQDTIIIHGPGQDNNLLV